jgi:hypothetical protein
VRISRNYERAPSGRLAEYRERRCTAVARSTGNRCGNAPSPGTNVCRFHGGHNVNVKRAAARRLEVAQALLDGLPHPAVVFFQMMKLRWTLSEDGSEVTCALPVEQLGGAQAVRDGLGWVHAWHEVMTYSKFHDRKYVEKRQGVRQRNNGVP